MKSQLVGLFKPLTSCYELQAGQPWRLTGLYAHLIFVVPKHTLHHGLQVEFLRSLYGKARSLKSGGQPSIHWGHSGRVRPIREIWTVPSTWIIIVRIRVIGRSQVEIIDIADLVSRVLGKRSPNLTIPSQMVNETTYFTEWGRGTRIHRIYI